MKATLRSIAALAVFAFSAPAFAGGVTVAENGDSKLKLEGTFYLNTKFTKKTNQAGTTDQTQGLSVDRAYFIAKYYFNDDWMVRITTDASLQTKLNSKNNNIFLKHAFIEGKLAGDAAVLRIGQSHTPWIDHEESLWKHRYAGLTLIDQKGFEASADLGLTLKGKLADGMVQYFIMESNGAGYSHPGMHLVAGTNDTWKKGLPKAFDLSSRIGFYPIEGLTLDFQFRDGYKGTKYFDAANNQTTPGTKHTLYQAMVTYGAHNWRFGANYVQEKADRKADTANGLTARTDKTTGYALWGWVKIPGTQFGAFGRYDYDHVSRSTVAGVKPKTNHYQLGAEYFPLKNVTFSLVADNSKTTDAGFTAGNFSKTTTYGLYSQIKF